MTFDEQSDARRTAVDSQSNRSRNLRISGVCRLGDVSSIPPNGNNSTLHWPRDIIAGNEPAARRNGADNFRTLEQMPVRYRETQR